MSAGRSSAELELICRSAVTAVFAAPSPEVSASFYPYIGLSHTVRRRGARWVFRLSDHCRDAPRPVLEAVALILASKLARRRPPKRALQIYGSFRREAIIETRLQTRRRERGRKRIDTAEGSHHSLPEIFRELDARYFNDQVEVCKLGWSHGLSWSRLGHYDPVHQTITISRVLDSPKVPRWAVAYLVYHEMLHAVFEGSGACRPGREHPPEFRRAERAYPDYARAKRFLDAYCRTRGRSRMARRPAPAAPGACGIISRFQTGSTRP